jgi:heme exporter protein D
VPVLCEGLNAFVKFLAWEHKCIFVWAAVGVVFECLLLCTSLLLHTQKKEK